MTTGPTVSFSAISPGRLRSVRRLTTRKERLAQGLFLAEGKQAVREALLADFAELVIVSQHDAAQHSELTTLAQKHRVEVLSAPKAEVAALSDTVTPQGIVAVCCSVAVDLEAALGERPHLVVLCASVRDPGNCGTVIRCADAFGADAVIISTGSVELANPKTVRASVGSLFHLPIAPYVPLEQAVEAVRSRGLQVLAADGRGDVLPDVDLSLPTCWVMGNEAWGLPEEVRELCDRSVGIPMWGKAESLNLSTAAAVCLYASAAAQRS